MVVEHMPLNGMIIDILVPMVIAYREISEWRKRIALEKIHELREHRLNSKMEDARQDAKLAFRGPVSYARQACRTSLVDKKMKAIENHWYAAAALMRREGLGITVH